MMVSFFNGLHQLAFYALIIPTVCGAGDWSFTDVTDQVVDVNPPGIARVFDYAFVDINDDKRLDIVVNNHLRSKPSPVWLGTRDHKFKFWGNMPQQWLPIAGFHLGEVDHDGDGKTDLICTGNEGGVVVNLNRSGDKTEQLSFESIPIKSSSHLVSFIDFDRDGKLETLVRPGLVFGDLREEPIMKGIQYGNWTIADFDNDGWPDLFGAGVKSRRSAWTGPRKLFRNRAGMLEEILAEDFVLINSHFGGIPKAADFNNDGHFDLYIFGGTSKESTEIKLAMKLFLGDGKFGFKDVSKQAGIAESTQKPGYSHVYVADIDNDTHLDIVNQGNYGTAFWQNNGDGTFTELPKALTRAWNSNAHMRFDDFDMDGRLDIVTAAVGPGWKDRAQSIRVFRNTIDNENHWLRLKLRQNERNTMAIGAVVTVYEAGTKNILGKQMLYSDTEGYHPRLHFGLGDHSKVDVEVIWPSKKDLTRFRALSADRFLVLRPDGTESEIE